MMDVGSEIISWGTVRIVNDASLNATIIYQPQ